VIVYWFSKTVLNVLKVEWARAEPNVRFYAGNPANCKTSFHGFGATKDLPDGAKAFVELGNGGVREIRE